MKISLNDIKAIGNDLAKREPTSDSVREMPVKEIVMALAPELSRMVGRGFTTGDLLAVLKEQSQARQKRCPGCREPCAVISGCSADR